MALEDYLESEVAIAVAATAAVLSPRVRRVLRRGAVYGVVGALKATDVVTASRAA
jgi:nucleoside phosphorylase